MINKVAITYDLSPITVRRNINRNSNPANPVSDRSSKTESAYRSDNSLISVRTARDSFGIVSRNNRKHGNRANNSSLSQLRADGKRMKWAGGEEVEKNGSEGGGVGSR